MIVNLGIGIPSLVPNFLPDGMEVMLQAENGVLGIGGSPERGEEDELLCNAVPDFLSVQLRVLPILIQLCLCHDQKRADRYYHFRRAPSQQDR